MSSSYFSKPLRIVMAVVSIPSLILAGMLVYLIVQGRVNEVGFYESLYALLGVFAIVVAYKGRLPFK